MTSWKFLLLPCFLLAVTACNEDNETTTGLPPGEGPRDSTGPIQSTVIKEGLITETRLTREQRGDELGRQLVGTYYDTVFGQMKGKAFFNFQLPREDFSDSFLDERIIDSAILTIPLDTRGNGGFGNFETQQTIEFFILDGAILERNPYDIRQDFQLESQPVAKWNDTFRLGQTLRVKLNDNFLEVFRNAEKGQLTTDVDFQNLFNGLGAVPADNFQQHNKGALAPMRLIDQASIVFYQPNGADSILVNDNAARTNTFSYDRSNATVELNTVNNKFAFVQPLGGVKTELRVPGAKQILDDSNTKVNVHEAKINLPVSRKYHEDRKPPRTLEVWADLDGEQALRDTPSYNAEQRRYQLNKPRYLQEILVAESEDRPSRLGALNIRLPPRPPRANPLLINGANNPSERGVTLEITYSKVRKQ